MGPGQGGVARLKAGLAWHYKQYAHEQSAEDHGQCAFAEVEARARRAGLWREGEPVAPWEWRTPSLRFPARG